MILLPSFGHAAVIFNFICLQASRIEVERPLAENEMDVMMEPQPQIILKRVRPDNLSKEPDNQKKPKFTVRIPPVTTASFLAAIDENCALKLDYCISNMNPDDNIDLDRALLHSVSRLRWPCSRILLRCCVGFSDEALQIAFVRSLQLRAFDLTETLLDNRAISSSHQMLKEGFLILLKLFCSPPTTFLAGIAQTIQLLIKKIVQDCHFKYMPVLSQIKYVRRTGSYRDLDSKLLTLNLRSIMTEVSPPENLANIRYYLQSKFTDDFQRRKWLIEYYGTDKLFKRVLYYLPRSILRSQFPTDPIAIPSMSKRSLAFYSRVLDEEPVEEHVHVTERFWANCLFDSYMHLFEGANKFYEGSVILDTDGTPITRLFPRFSAFFLEHFMKTRERMNISDEEKAKVDRLQRLLENVAESSRRYRSSKVKLAVMQKLKRLQPGEEYCLDIYALDSPKHKQGHLVVGIVTREEDKSDDEEVQIIEDGVDEPQYNIQIVNSGAKSFEACGLNRQLICVDQLGIPKKAFMSRYLHVINGPLTDIYMPEYLPEAGLYDPTTHKFQESDNPIIIAAMYALAMTIRGQNFGTCSIRRLWALAKLILGPALYMEFKVHFILIFLEFLHKSFSATVNRNWKSPRASVWLAIISSPLFERNLLKQLERLDTASQRYHSLREAIFDSIRARYGTDNIDEL